MNPIWLFSFLIGLVFLIPNVYAETTTHNIEGGMDLEISYPEEIVVGRDGIISILIKNNGWEDKQDVSITLSSPDNTFHMNVENMITIDKLAQGGSYGANIEFSVPDKVNEGTHFLNMKYSHVLVANNQTPQPAIFNDIALPITIKEDPGITISTTTPESIFANAEFPIEIEIVSEDIDITNLNIKIIPPKDIEFRGETSHTFSKLEKDTPLGITSHIITPTNEVNTEYKLPFEIIVVYTDDVGEEKVDSQTVSTILRPRTFMELTTDGGIWIGDFFIAPYVSLGTIIGIPAGAVISLLIRRNQNSTKKRKRKK